MRLEIPKPANDNEEPKAPMWATVLIVVVSAAFSVGGIWYIYNAFAE